MTCRSVSEFLDKHANDVSRGGIFVRNAQVLAVGCTVRLNLQLADGSTLLAGEGTVFWTREADPTRAESEPGMGIRFTRLTNESQRMLTHLLAEKTERERHEVRPEFDDDDERTVVATQEELEAAATSGDAPSAPIEAMPALASVPLTISAPPAAPPIRPRVSTRVLASVPSAPSISHTLAKVVPLPTPSAHVHAVPAPQMKPLEKVVEMSAPVAIAPAPAPVPARRITVAPVASAPAPISLPVPASSSAAWEEDEEPIVPRLPRAHEADAEETDLVPRGNRSVGIGVAVGAIAALVASLLLLNKPFMRHLPILARNTPAKVVVAPPPVTTPAPVIAPLEPAAAPIAPLEPTHP